MEQDKKSLWIKYVVAFIVGCAIVLFVFSIKGFFGTDKKQNIQLLHDAFFTAGALLMLFSGFLYVSDEGVFLGFGFAMSRAIKALIPGKKDYETYAQYRERKTGSAKGKKGKHCLLLTGLFFFLISLIFLAVWYNV